MHPLVRQAADRVRRAVESRRGAFVAVLPSDVEAVMTGNPPAALSPREARKRPPERPVAILAAELEKWLLRAEARPAPPPPQEPPQEPPSLPEGGE
jgi:hypothetical protein